MVENGSTFLLWSFLAVLLYFTYLKFCVGLQQYAKRNLLMRQLPVVSLYEMSSKTHHPPAES
ncbi:hypothetical protein CSKR_103533 [Clonorchis sinensis]|uniref:Uncharacterized protein n=1 Tax=Clonorchis sinensis TaxID=79923 RepID=A0A419PJ46_CLOSI|nr:hypothetical protein CSKR_103533 [Clonorchis sinensis]